MVNYLNNLFILKNIIYIIENNIENVLVKVHDLT